MHVFISRSLRNAGLYLVFLLGVSVFQFNSLHSADSRFFEAFDRFSQGLVVGNIVAHDVGIADQTWNLGFVAVNGDQERSENIWATYQQAVRNGALKSVVQAPYISQYGIQGVAFQALQQMFGITDFAVLQLFNSILFSLVITALAFLFGRAYDWRFGVVFFLVTIGSPWIVAFARNLYWVPFTWFLPAVFAAMAYLCKTNLTRALCLCGVAAAVFLKSLAGYEYLSNITLFACSIFVIGPFFRQQAPRHGFNFALGCLAFLACVVGFACALLIHAGMRGDTVVQGLINILEQDVKRVSYGNPGSFEAKLHDSLSASLSSVLAQYWTQWSTPVVAGISAKVLDFAVAFALLGSLYALARKQLAGTRVLVVLGIYFAASISWFVAAKSHSYIHTQLNFVLWYFGFIQALAYGVLCIALLLGRDFLAWRKTLSRRNDLLLKGSLALGLIIVLAGTYNARLERFDARIGNPVASIDVGHGFEVRLLDDKAAILMKADCSDFNPAATVILHAYPDLPQAAPINLDFAWDGQRISAPWLSKYSDACVTNLPLAGLEVKSIDVGQYEIDGEQRLKILWMGTADLQGKR